jgi:flagellar hook-associated protein 3 FlgL
MDGISTLFNNDMLRSRIGLLQSEMASLQQQTASGKKADRYGDLGADAQPAINLSTELDAFGAYQTTVTQLQSRTDLMDKALGAIKDTANAVQLTASQLAAGGVQTGSPANLQTAAANAVGSITSQLQTEIAGFYLFAGDNLQQPPMVASQTVLGQVQAAVTAALGTTPPPANVPNAISQAVDSVFATQSNVYVGGNPLKPTRVSDTETVSYGITANDPRTIQLLKGLYTIAATPVPGAGSPAMSTADYEATMQAAQTDLAAGLNGLDVMVTTNGMVQNRLAAVAGEQTDTQALLKTEFGSLTDADMADVATRLSNLQTQLNAVYAVTAQLKNLSLVNFLQ